MNASITLGFRKILQVLVVILAFYFIAQILEGQWGHVQGRLFDVRYSYLIGASVVYSIFFFYQGYLCKGVLNHLGAGSNYFESCYFFMTAVLLGYIPGKVVGMVGVTNIAEKCHASKSQAVVATYFFQIYLMLGSVLSIAVFYALLITLGTISLNWKDLMCFSVILTLLLIFLMPNVFHTLRKIIKKITGYELPVENMVFKDHIKYGLLFCVKYFVLGFVAFLLLKTVYHDSISASDYLALNLAFVGSFLFSRLVFLAPSGLGVLELGIVYSIGQVFSDDIGLWLAASFRIVTIVLVLFWYCVFSIIYKRRVQ